MDRTLLKILELLESSGLGGINNISHIINDDFKFFKNEPEFKIRQTTINSAGEIGKTNFDIVEHFFDKGLFDIF